MRTSLLFSVLRCMAVHVLLWTCIGATAQSATPDQSLKNLPKSVKDNAETKLVTKTNTTSNNAMNGLDSASNKAFRGFTGLFKKKNKPKKTDSAVTRPPDTTQGPKSSLIIRRSINLSCEPFVANCYATSYLRRPRTIRSQNKIFS